MDTSDSEYQLGHDDPELERLHLQGRLLAPATGILLETAGLRPGMRVLDLGAGMGDAAFVAAELVGSGGEVVGVELSADAVGHANGRAGQLGLANVRFIQGDIHDQVNEGEFDAVICRLVLMYLPEPAAVLRTQARTLRAGGIVAPIEFDVLTGRSVPPTALVAEALGWLAEAFSRGGIHPALGPQLWSVLVDAGLSPSGMLGIQPQFGPHDQDGSSLLAGIVRTCLPLLERTGVANASEVDVDTLERRLAEERASARAVFAHPTLFSAWAVTRS